jgi:formyl-CoA transferase
MSNSHEVKFLEGVKIVDFTQFEAGPSATEALAWLGADVVKIENPKVGDPGRRIIPGKPETDPYYFHMFNANKKSLTVDLKSSKGLALVKDLLKKADVTIENMAPGTIDRLGLGYDAVKAINPGIIYASVKGFGVGSPFEKFLAFDMIAQATGGIMSVTGDADRPPSKPGVALGDTGTGMLMAITLASALYNKQKTGQGCRLTVGMQDAMLHYMRIGLSSQARTGKVTGRNGAKMAGINIAPSGIYPCKPGGPNDWVYVFCSRANPEHWTRLLKVIGREDLIGNERYGTPQARFEHFEEVEALIAAWTKNHTKHEAMKLIGEAGVPAGAVLDTMEVQNDPTFEQRGIMQVMHHTKHGPYKMPGWPVQVNGKSPTLKPSPMLGEHNGEVLQTWLAMKPADVAALQSEGVIGQVDMPKAAE